MSALTSIPTDGFLGTTHHNVAAAVFPVGTKVTIKQDAGSGVTAGFCTFIYTGYTCGTNTYRVVGSAKDPLQLYAGSTTELGLLCGDWDEVILGGPGSISIGAGTDGATFPTDDYYIWSQCGGPICNGNATAIATTVLDGNFVTDTAIAAKEIVGFTTDGTIGNATTGGTPAVPALLGDVYGFIISNTADTSNDIDAMHLYIIDKF